MRSCSFVLALLLGANLPGYAQEPDTSLAQKLLQYELRIDSMRQIIRTLDAEVQYLKRTIAEESEGFQQLLDALAGEEAASIPEDQRSRRRRVDALLRVITRRPGQLRFNGGTTTILQSSLRGPSDFSTAEASMDLFAHTNFGDNILLFIDLEGVGGDGPSPFVPAHTNLNADAGSTQSPWGLDQVHILEAWSEFTALGGAVVMTAGKIDLTNYFDANVLANDETSQFITDAFVNGAAFAVPSNSAGIRARTTLAGRLYLQLAVAKAQNTGSEITRGLYRIGSFGFRVFPDSPWEGNVRVFLYEHPDANYAPGYGVSFDQRTPRGLGVFARYGWNSSRLARIRGVRTAWSLGAEARKVVLGRSWILAAAFGSTELSDSGSSEKVAEAYLKHPINRWIHLSFHGQYLRSPVNGNQDVLVGGVRVQYNF